MVKHLTKIGNSLGLIIEKPILELLDIDDETQLEMKTDGKALIIQPLKGNRKRRIKAVSKKIMDTHDDTFRELAK